ncbi:uncharacterized protein LOC124272924 [Haliotis rubra]|uniref:uncharacterized protein LOC124272924 n=1 Tax=Haliotis rubra TaxID=36100 RepID=UPI001EE5F2ED|nr:uncharacterized protein LOC124272924 [Haliotis rubra]
MTLRITPQVPSFNGTIFVEGKVKTTACRMALVSGTTQTYELTLTHIHSTCGNAVHNASTDSNTRKFYVLFASNSIVLTSDEVVTAICDDTHSTAVTFQLSSIDIDGILSPVGVDMSIKDEDVNLTLTVLGSPVSSSVNLGDDINATIEMTAAGMLKFEALRVEGCVASNTLTGGDLKSVRFIAARSSVVASPSPTPVTGGRSGWYSQAFSWRRRSGRHTVYRQSAYRAQTVLKYKASSLATEEMTSH